MLGGEFVRQLQGGTDEVVAWSRADVDITNEQAVMRKVAALKPQVILNCAAYNNVDKAEDEPEVANAINGEAAGYLAKAAVASGATFTHFSTDYVFGGNREDGYNEEDVPDPISKYGESKALGEQKLLTHLPTYSLTSWYIIRTSKLFGLPGTGATSKKSFPEMMLRFAKEKGRIEAIDAERGSPTYVKDFAQAVLGIIDNKVSSGIYHITNSGSCTWYEYAKAAVEFAGVHAEVVPVGPEKFPRKAKRPANSILVNTKLPPLRPWQDALQEYLTTASPSI